jgi:hypothetical protein
LWHQQLVQTPSINSWFKHPQFISNPCARVLRPPGTGDAQNCTRHTCCVAVTTAATPHICHPPLHAVREPPNQLPQGLPHILAHRLPHTLANKLPHILVRRPPRLPPAAPV